MPRTARKISETGYYHVILRGVNQQDIFLDDGDRYRMLYTLKKYCDETGTEIVVYCLMSNHIHLLVKTDDLSLFVQKITCCYVLYFNRKYERVGHLFQNRFISFPIEDEAYFLIAAKYILKNPEKAGICAVTQYRWSSWKELKGHPWLTNPEPLIRCFSSPDEMYAFLLGGTKKAEEDEFMEAFKSRWISEEDAIFILNQISGCRNPLMIAKMPKNDRIDTIRQAKKAGLTIRQISRLTGIGRGTIQHVK